MEEERKETYERIPWEMLERKGGDRQWGMFVVAGAIVVGALAYSFVSNRAPSAPEVAGPPVATTAPAVAAPILPIEPTATTLAAPVVVSEADLYALDPERVLDQAVSHAEWFVAEWFTVDGSRASADVLGALLPAGVPAGKSGGHSRVFVEWVRAISVEEIASFRYRVAVLVRYLTAAGDEPYARRPPVLATVEVASDELGPRIVLPPSIQSFQPGESADPGLTTVPDEVANEALDVSGGSEVIGGLQRGDGSWSVVVLAPGPGGTSRAQTVDVP